MGIREQIRHWADIIRESDELHEQTKTQNAEELSRIHSFLDFVASENGLEFVAFRDGEEFCTGKTVSELLKNLGDGKNVKRLEGMFRDQVAEDPDRYGVEYRDDSDYSDEGYGQYGEYDERQISEIASEMAQDVIEGVTNGLEDTDGLGRLMDEFNDESPTDKGGVARFFERNPICDVPGGDSEHVRYQVSMQ